MVIDYRDNFPTRACRVVWIHRQNGDVLQVQGFYSGDGVDDPGTCLWIPQAGISTMRWFHTRNDAIRAAHASLVLRRDEAEENLRRFEKKNFDDVMMALGLADNGAWS